MVLGSTAFCRDMIQEHLSALNTGADRNGTTQHYNNNFNPGSLVASRIRQFTILSRFLSSISMLLVPYFMYCIHSNLGRINIINIKSPTTIWVQKTYCSLWIHINSIPKTYTMKTSNYFQLEALHIDSANRIIINVNHHINWQPFRLERPTNPPYEVIPK